MPWGAVPALEWIVGPDSKGPDRTARMHKYMYAPKSHLHRACLYLQFVLTFFREKA